MSKIRPIAIHLPQFHPFPENDEWWGKGFTEWTNVTKAKPLFEGHYQPHLPADLGFYDLRLEEARLAQEALAKEYGIYGFCYYHYWFNGKTLMHEPIKRKLQNSDEDLPFMLCWANENWSRAWDGKDNDVLIEQHYSLEDDLEHIRFLLPIFKDERYIKVDGKPVFVIYKIEDFPDPISTIKLWRREAAKVGLELYLCRMDRNTKQILENDLINEFDASVEFQPLSKNIIKYLDKRKQETHNNNNKNSILNKIINKFKYHFLKSKSLEKVIINKIDYPEFVEFDLSQNLNKKMFPGVSPGWDNTSRRKTGITIFVNSTPDIFKKWIIGKLKKFNPPSKEENLFFINAWNEWAEGNHLEPCKKWGTDYLKVIKTIFKTKK